tara:strand:+ start:1849 stop:3597 length:1749 start_codon:yes stop_codon:yes gene_type:complete
MASSIELLVRDEFGGKTGTRNFNCPSCSPERSPRGARKRPLTVTFEKDAAVFFCHHCEQKGQVRLAEKKRTLKRVPNYSKVGEKTIDRIMANRSINLRNMPDSVMDSICQSEDVFFTELGGKSPAIGFRYPADDAIKWRSMEGKNFTASGAARSLFPEGQSIEKGQTVHLVEGEFDALALISCGMVAFSTPAGANIPASGELPEYLKPLVNDLRSGIIEVVIAVDSDERGVKFRDSLVDHIGRERVSFIDWSEFGVKDANELLVKSGSESLADAVVSGARPVLFEGIVSPRQVASSIDQIRTGGFRQGTGIGIPSLDRLMTICSDQISVVTGVPGSGKSELIDAFMVRLAEKDDWKFAIFSAENPIDIHVGKLAEKFIGAPVFEGENRMSRGQMARASAWLDDHFFFLDASSNNSLKSILDRTAVLVEHRQVNGLLIDPFNYTDVSLDTDSISTMLTELHAFALKFHIHIWIVAHPQKMYRQEGGRMPTPTGMDISGSAAWFAKADFGLTVERTDDDETKVIVWKCRFKWLGDLGTAYLRYDSNSGRFEEGSSAEKIAETIENVTVSGESDGIKKESFSFDF